MAAYQWTQQDEKGGGRAKGKKGPARREGNPWSSEEYPPNIQNSSALTSGWLVHFGSHKKGTLQKDTWCGSHSSFSKRQTNKQTKSNLVPKLPTLVGFGVVHFEPPWRVDLSWAFSCGTICCCGHSHKGQFAVPNRSWPLQSWALLPLPQSHHSFLASQIYLASICRYSRLWSLASIEQIWEEEIWTQSRVLT